FSYPSWKVIVSASRVQYLKPGSSSPAFFLRHISSRRRYLFALSAFQRATLHPTDEHDPRATKNARHARV
ncbi:MAG: hypothetical protein J0H75_16790, partial [Rhizobiales bacterium]|nr:hypothetical protein [Hyphomicrobiales bacterium]